MDSTAITARIKEIMDHYYLSASNFADEIGVQRSSMSHILSGRNKPSLDFILKVTKRFPDVNMDWLLNGEGSFLGNEKNAVTDAVPSSISTQISPPAAPIKAKNDTNENSTDIVGNDPTIPATLGPLSAADKSKKIRQIIVFYEDGTFDQFSPN